MLMKMKVRQVGLSRQIRKKYDGRQGGNAFARLLQGVA
jgi:hypothetical protein